MYFIDKIKTDNKFRERETEKLYDMIKLNVAYTHAGIFHADDVASTALLRIVNPKIIIKRIYDCKNISNDYLLFDIGCGDYDHHQRNNERRNYKRNGEFVPYASFGKLWEVLGPELVGYKYYETLDHEVASHIDYADNTGYKNALSVLIDGMNPKWDEEQCSELSNQCFEEAVNIMVIYLNNYIQKLLSLRKADEELEKILERKQTKIIQGKKVNICVEDKFVPIIKQLMNTDVSFYIYPSLRGGYCVSPIKDINTNEIKIPFAPNLYGKSDIELRETIPGLSFVHANGFLAVTDTVDAAFDLIDYSIEHNNDAEEILYLAK